MAINNSHKPIGSNVRQDIQKQVGGTYGERRHLTNNRISAEPAIQRPKDFFGHKADEAKTVGETFASNAEFVRGKIIQPHKVIEAGKAHPRYRVTDETRLGFLDRIIAGQGENRPPTRADTSSKTSIKPTIKPTRTS